MVSLPQLVRRRLQWQAEAGPHPEPDQLTAFIECSLPDVERAHVLQHMAACTECRETVFLSLPEMETGYSPTPDVRRRWLQWPALRWGAVAACALVVGAAVTLQRPSPSEVAAPTVAGVGSDRAAMASKPLSANSRSSAMVTSDEKGNAEKELDKLAKSQAANPHFATQLNSTADAIVPPSPAPSRKTADAPAAAPPPSELSPKVSTLSKGPLRDENRRAEKRGEELDSLAGNAPSAPPSADAEPATGKAKEPLSQSEIGAEAKKSGLRNEQAAAASGLVLAPRWTLSADGTLQRSFNAGTTWDTISVPSNAKLRALAAIGYEIWVGGSGGALYHSSDAGNHWRPVTPAAAGQQLTSDIIGVEFTDTQHGTLSLADGEAWTTADGGQSWNIR